jgi:predicted membrane chloride channel (bestrophin family)
MVGQINIFFGAYGAMEWIKGTPLPFAYVAHLRSFLLIYLFLMNMIEVAKYEWVVREESLLADEAVV